MENTDKPKNTKPQIFRDTANDEEWKKLVELALSTNPIGTKVPDEYGFSWSAIRSDAVAWLPHPFRIHPLHLHFRLRTSRTNRNVFPVPSNSMLTFLTA